MTSAAPEPAFSPSMQMVPAQQLQGSFGSTDMAGLFKEQQTFMEKQQMLLIERDAKARAETDAKMERQRVELRAEMDAKIAELTPQEAVSTEQLAALQARVEQLHAAKHLTDHELFACEGEWAGVTCAFTVDADVRSFGRPGGGLGGAQGVRAGRPGHRPAATLRGRRPLRLRREAAQAGGDVGGADGRCCAGAASAAEVCVACAPLCDGFEMEDWDKSLKTAGARVLVKLVK